MWHPHDRNDDGLVILVDDREGGGDGHYLERIARTFQSEKIRFETTRLPPKLHDYAFVYRRRGLEDILLPLLVERKAEVDLAASMKDGRWMRQHVSMQRTALNLYGKEGCRCMYILEGNVYQVFKCPCGCHGVGGCVQQSWPVELVVRTNVRVRQKSTVGDFEIEFFTTKDVVGTCRVLKDFRDMIETMYQEKGRREDMLDGVKWCDLHVFRPVRVCPVACLVDGEKMQDDDQREEREESPHGTKTSASSASSSSSSSLSSSIPPPSPAAAAATSVPASPTTPLIPSASTAATTPSFYHGDYFPQEKTCNWAILVWLAANENNEQLRFNQDDIMHGCDRWSLSSAGMHSRKTQQGMYNGWSNVEQQLIQKHKLVTRHYRKSGIETQYSLTPIGRCLGRLLHSCAHQASTCSCKSNDVVPCTNMWSKVAMDKWPLKILKQTCKRRGLAVSGNKSVLVQRLRQQLTPVKRKSTTKLTKKQKTPGSNQQTIKRFFKSVKKVQQQPVVAVEKKKKQTPTQRTLFSEEEETEEDFILSEIEIEEGEEEEEEEDSEWEGASEDEEDEDSIWLDDE